MVLAVIDVKPGAMPPDTPNLNMCVHEWHISHLFIYQTHQHDSQESLSNSEWDLKANEIWSVYHTKLLSDFRRPGIMGHLNSVFVGKQLLGCSSKYLRLVFRRRKTVIRVCIFCQVPFISFFYEPFLVVSPSELVWGAVEPLTHFSPAESFTLWVPA